jgi:hypothetical protein
MKDQAVKHDASTPLTNCIPLMISAINTDSIVKSICFMNNRREVNAIVITVQAEKQPRSIE